MKKFFGKDNFITLHPQGYTIKNKFQNQVFVTHKKYGEIEKTKSFVNKELPSIIENLSTLISTEICENKFILAKRKNEESSKEKKHY